MRAMLGGYIHLTVLRVFLAEDRSPAVLGVYVRLPRAGDM